LLDGVINRFVWNQAIRRGQQQEEERPVSFVFGSGSAAFRTLHDDIPFGCAHAPPPCSPAFLQELFKNLKLVRHRDRALRSAYKKMIPQNEEKSNR
jgi:hypothetical protein